MKFVHPEIKKVFDFEENGINTLIVENPAFLCRFLTDIQNQINGENGVAVLSENNAPIDFPKNAEILSEWIPFEINKKALLTKIVSAFEKNALSPEHYEKSMQLIGQAEAFLDELAYAFPCDIVFPKLSMSALIKSAAPELRDEYTDLGEKILDYMELVTEFDRKKLFITVNLRPFLSDLQMEMFAKTALSHGFRVFMVEAFEKSRFSLENRLIIDNDLCEIG